MRMHSAGDMQLASAQDRRRAGCPCTAQAGGGSPHENRHAPGTHPESGSHLPALLVVRAVYEHAADLAHCHDALWLGELLLQGIVLGLEGLSLLNTDHAAVYVALLCQLGGALCGRALLHLQRRHKVHSCGLVGQGPSRWTVHLLGESLRDVALPQGTDSRSGRCAALHRVAGKSCC